MSDHDDQIKAVARALANVSPPMLVAQSELAQAPGSIRPDIFGWFDSSDQTVPAHDPGLKAPCPVCAKELAAPMKTISLMTVDTGSDRSYFFRAHKQCWEGISEHERGEIEGSLVDAVSVPKPICPMCLGTGTTGDHGPGRRGNDEVRTFDCQEVPPNTQSEL